MQSKAPFFTPVLLVGCCIIVVSFAVRASFGVFQIPIADGFGWLRSEFSLAIAIQNLAWGIGQPIFGAIAERVGDRKAIILGALMYAAGLILSSFAISPQAHQMYEILVGFGVAGTGFGVILAVVGRASSDEHRSMSLAMATAAGSAGQVIGAPLPMMKSPKAATRQELEESMGEILVKALKDPSYTMIFLGFFSCGYQLAFVTAHFPAFVTELCGPIMPGGALHSMGITTTSALGAMAISLIGFTNILGTLLAGYLGKRYTKKYLLSAIYAGRTVIAAWFIMTPMTPTTVLIFSAAMGSRWLATVPLTSGLIAHIYGVRYMGTLYGIVFFSHQLGSFAGVWLGGKMYDVYGDYTVVWWVGVGVGAFSALIHLPVNEKRSAQPA